jgi:hypothetical protein
MDSRIYLLIKVFDTEEYADAFIRTGEMFCKTIKQFKEIEGDVARGDRYEAVTAWHQPGDISLTISYKTSDGEETSMPITGLAGPLIIQNLAHDSLNAYCMYSITAPEFNESFETEEERVRAVEKVNALLKAHTAVDDDMLSLGEHAVIIINVPKFIKKVSEAAKAEGYDSWNGLIKYFDPNTFNGSFGNVESVFMKRNIYSYQKEFRFVFDSDSPEGAKLIHAGSLEGIALKLKTSEINTKIEIKIDEDSAQLAASDFDHEGG